MQQSIELKPRNEAIAQAEAFVERVCDELHLPNEFASISMSVIKAVQVESSFTPNPDKCLCLGYGYCNGGIYFDVSHYAKDVDFSVADLLLEDEASEAVFLIRSLADRVQVLEEEQVLRLVFLVNGIDSMQSHARQSVLQKFYMHDVVSA